MINPTPTSIWARSLHAHTAMLEACDWDEEVYDQLTSALGIMLTDSARSQQPLTRKALVDVFEQLVPDSTDEQIDTIVGLLRTEIRAAVSEVES